MLKKGLSFIKDLWIKSDFLSLIFGHNFQGHKELAVECTYSLINNNVHNNRNSSFDDFLRPQFLFAVPKSRRTVQKRRNRLFGWPEYVWKPLVPKTNILMCNTCGRDYEAGHLCGYCYKRVQEETEEMQKAIEAELKLDSQDKEVIVLYENEAQGKPDSFWEGKRIVEIKKKRPSWFSDNLIQRSTTEDENIKHDKPKDLA